MDAAPPGADDDPVRAHDQMQRLNALIGLGRLDEAEALAPDALTRCRRFDVLDVEQVLARLHATRGRAASAALAVGHHRQALVRLGAEPPADCRIAEPEEADYIASMSDVQALLHTDVVDSTALADTIGDAAMTELWRAHLRGSRDLLRRFHGHEVDNSDGLMLRFDSAHNALEFAVAYHRLLAEGLPHPIKARVGLHVGRLDLRANEPADVELGARAIEVLGLTKVIAARLMALAIGGQTLVSPEALAALQGTPHRLMRHGHWRMKGLSEPIEVWEAGAAGAPFEPPPDGPKAQRVVRTHDRWAPLSDVWHTLPAERDRFIGRIGDLQSLVRRLREGARLLTLHGSGGIGKTRLALRYGWTWLGDHPGGVGFCDLSSATTADGVIHSMAQALELPLGSDPLTQIGRAIAARGRCLLIVDNVEQVIEPVRVAMGRWLDVAPEAQFVATSRVTLGMSGEVVLALDPLLLPEAVALFNDRAAAASKDYAAEAADPVVLETLARQLDGLPLAVELAAARVRTMTPEQILARIDRRFRLLASAGSRPGRQATLKAMLDWSWDLLDKSEQRALLQLSIFEGSFSLAAAESVLELGGRGSDLWVPDIVQSLVEKSLVRPDGRGRFSLLRSVQDYLRARLEPEATRGLERRHWSYLSGLDEATFAAAPHPDLENAVAACRRATVAGDAAAAVRCLALAWAGLRLTGPLRLVDTLAQTLRELPGGLESEQRLTIEWLSASACFASGALADAAEACERGIAILDSGAFGAAVATRVLTIAGEVAAAQGATDRANGCFARATQLCEGAAAGAASRCHLLNARALWAADCGRHDEARDLYEQALAVAEGAADLRWQGGILGNLGLLTHSQGKLDEAVGFYERALALSTTSGDKRWEGNMRCNLGLALLVVGVPADARKQLLTARNIGRAVGSPALESVAECNLGVLSMVSGSEDEAHAVPHLRQAIEVAAAAGDSRTAAQAGAYLSCALGRIGDWEAAEQALERLRRPGGEADPLAHGIAWCARSELASARGDRTAAAASLRQARDLLAREHWGESSELGVWLAMTEARLQLPRLAIVGSYGAQKT